jgi:type VI secretion system protein ImpH
MSFSQRRDSTGVIHQLLRNPQQFDFFQAVRLLDGWLAGGQGVGAALDRVRYRNSLSLAFPAGEIESIKVNARVEEPSSGEDKLLQPGDVEEIELTPAFMGLLGPNGGLPTYYTETLAQRELYQKDHGARAFLDIFQHRAVSLFYEAWCKHRQHIGHERGAGQSFLPLLQAIAGFSSTGGAANEGDDAPDIPPETIAYYAGAIQQRVWPAERAQTVLSDHFRVPVRIEQFVGRWYPLPDSGKFYLGQSDAANPGLGLLGHSALLGDRVWQRDGCMRVVIGPLSRDWLKHFLPGGKSAKALKAFLTMFFGAAFVFEINLRLSHQQINPIKLDSDRPDAMSRLGLDTFLYTRQPECDRHDVRYDIHALA